MLRSVQKVFPAYLFFALTFFMMAGQPLFAEDSSDAVQAENAFFRGSHLLSRDNIQEALSALEKATKLDPQNNKYKSVLAVAYNNYGLRLNREGKVPEGIRYMVKALKLTPDDQDIRSNFIQSALQAAVLPKEKVQLKDKMDFVQQVLKSTPTMRPRRGVWRPC